jgi:hypothetical protein
MSLIEYLIVHGPLGEGNLDSALVKGGHNDLIRPGRDWSVFKEETIVGEYWQVFEKTGPGNGGGLLFRRHF